MSGEGNNTNNTPAMEQILAMFNSLKADLSNNNDNINSLKADMNNNNNAIEVMQAENVTLREELLARIDNRSRLSSRASSRATSPRQLAARLQSLHEKMPGLEMTSSRILWASGVNDRDLC